jgi:stage V sporulation protein AC
VDSDKVKLAGFVILFGIFSAFIVATMKAVLTKWGGLRCT